MGGQEDRPPERPEGTASGRLERKAPGRLEGQVALVTGGGDGIGRAVVERYVREGADVVVLERDAGLAKAVEAAHPGRVAALAGDVRDPAAHVAATQCGLDVFGRLTVYVGNVGVYDYGARLADLELTELSGAFHELFATNVLGYLLGVRAALPALRDGGGSVILTGSSSGSFAGGGGALYVASKHAVVGLVRQLAYELAPDVRVNGIAPGATRTGLTGVGDLGGDRRLRDEPRSLDGIARTVPLGFVSEPDHHAGLYVALASSEDTGFVTGAVWASDGGLEVRGRRHPARPAREEGPR
ncbi:SDR family NAD(P)-dependent oxidoreductase [Actinomadura rupiterrae]|uniref:SDR family NAD(P)-dependent oxidoreductase n=1 Tax=Actinomadura rupiterrae TaxID=559627 RepID=UPI0020A3CC03|nr:SDR family NAD(P)-dependent oxidoreductase [Actinomadura rupiterrae]MCP2338685.1 cis-3,4-dihydrophenanthrene-3,4-diol dehydrogenase [Actinomadura rupiterrae]